jgi:hypothetical protein
LPFPAVYPVLITVPDAVVVMACLLAQHQFPCVLSICAEQDDTYYLKTRVKRLNFIGVLKEVF